MRSLGPLLIVILFVLFRIVSAIATASKKSGDRESSQDETEEQKRMREVQEQIRRKIAERRGGAAPPIARSGPLRSNQPRSRPAPPPVARPSETFNPFGLPEEFRVPSERTTREEPAPAEMPDPDAAILERQQKLAAEMRSLAAARAATVRRASDMATEQAANTATSSGGKAQAAWMGDLRDRQGLRRAIVLREILGPPVSLR